MTPADQAAEASGPGTLARSRSGQWLLGLLALGLIVWVVEVGSRGFFSGDSGMKFAQTEALLDSHFTSRQLPYDYALDPKGRYHPYGGLTIPHGQGRQGVYSWVFTGLAAPLIAVAGLDGVVILPLLGGLLLLWSLYAIGRALDHAPWMAALAAGFVIFGTPVLFYSSQFAEHTIATGCTSAALAVLLGSGKERRHLWAGVLVALGATVRPEAYCAVSALGIVVFLQPAGAPDERWRRSALFLAGCVSLLLLYWGVNWLSAGSWDPVSQRNFGRRSSLASAAVMWAGEVRAGRPGLWLLSLAVPVAIGSAPRVWRRRPETLGIRLGLGFALVLSAVLAYRLAEGRTLVGLFGVTPLVAYGLLSGISSDRTRALWTFATAFTLQVMVFDSSGTAGGLQLGARLLMPALPVLVLLAVEGVAADWRLLLTSRQRFFAALPAALLAAQSAFFLTQGLPAARQIAEQGWRATQVAAAVPGGAVVAERWWDSQVIAAVVHQGKAIYSLEGNPAPLLNRLADAGTTSFAYVGRHGPQLTLSKGRSASSERLSGGLFPVHRVTIRSAQSN